MEARKVCFPLLPIAISLVCWSCSVTEVEQPGPAGSGISISIDTPTQGEWVSPIRILSISGEAECSKNGPGRYKILIGDSVITDNRFRGFIEFENLVVPAVHLNHDSTMVIKGLVTNALGDVEADSLTVFLGAYYDSAPIVESPLDHTISVGQSTREVTLVVQHYDLAEIGEIYEFELEFGTPPTSSIVRSFVWKHTYTFETPGTLRWRARVVSPDSSRSPWSPFQRYTFLDEYPFDPDHDFGVVFNVTSDPEGHLITSRSEGSYWLDFRSPDWGRNWKVPLPEFGTQHQMAMRGTFTEDGVSVGSTNGHGDDMPAIVNLDWNGEFLSYNRLDFHQLMWAFTGCQGGNFLCGFWGGGSWRYPVLTMVDPTGEPLWRHTWEGYCLAVFDGPEEGTAKHFTDVGRDYRLGKIGHDGTTLWETDFYVPGMVLDLWPHITQKNNGDCLIGWCGRDGSGSPVPILTQIDDAGTVTWVREVPTGFPVQASLEILAIQKAPSGGCVLVGGYQEKSGWGTAAGLVVLVDDNGYLQWMLRVFGVDGFANVAPTENFIVVLGDPWHENDPWYFDYQGNLIQR